MDENKNVNPEVGASAPVKADNKMVMGILAYIGFLVLIPFFLSKQNPFVKFHVKQGLVLFAIEIIIWILGSFLLPYYYSIYWLIQLIDIVVIVLSIIGIVNVVQNNQKELPLVGQFSKYFKF